MARGFFNSSKQPAKRSAETSSTPPPASSSTAAGLAGATAQEPASISAEALANLSMVNDLLHSPSTTLPTDELESELEALITGDGDGPACPASPHPSPAAAANAAPALLVDPQELEGLPADEVMALIKRRTKAVAERAFWTAVHSRIHSSLKVGTDSIVNRCLKKEPHCCAC
jgi:hypothetical protein